MCVLSLAKSSGKQSFGREHTTKNLKNDGGLNYLI